MFSSLFFEAEILLKTSKNIQGKTGPRLTGHQIDPEIIIVSVTFSKIMNGNTLY